MIKKEPWLSAELQAKTLEQIHETEAGEQDIPEIQGAPDGSELRSAEEAIRASEVEQSLAAPTQSGIEVPIEALSEVADPVISQPELASVTLLRAVIAKDDGTLLGSPVEDLIKRQAA